MFKSFIKGMLSKDAVSEDHAIFLCNVRKRNITIRFFQLFILVSFFLSWEILARTEVINSFLMSQPSKMWDLFLQMSMDGRLFQHIRITLIEDIVGFTLGTFFGTLIAISLWWSDYLFELLEPYIIIMNSIPKVALGPVIIVWLGNGPAAIIVMALLVSIVVTILMLTNGFREVESNKIKLLKTLGAKKIQILLKVILPSSIPTIFSAIKVSVGLSLVGTIVGEFLVSKAGLGYLIVYGGQVFNLHMVMTSIVILSIIAGLMYYLIVLMEKIMVKWK